MPLLRWILVLMILPVMISRGQSIDNLKDSLKAARIKSDQEDIDRYLLKIANACVKQGELDTASKYSRILLQRSLLSGDKLYEARTLNTIANIKTERSDPDSAIFYYKRAINIYKVAGDTTEVAIALSNLGRVYRELGLSKEAIAVSMDALPYLEPYYHDIRKGDQALATCYNIIASCYNQLKEFKYALEFNRKALSIRIESDNLKGAAVSYNNIANVYTELSQYDSAISNLHKALNIRKSIKENWGSTLHNLGDVMVAQKRYNEAGDYYYQSLERKKLENDVEGLPLTLNGLGKVLIRKGAFVNAVEYLNQADSIARSMRLMKALRDNLELKMSLYDSLNNPYQAFIAAKELLAVKDSLLDERKSQSVVEMQIRYESEKSAQEIKLLNAEKLLDKNRIKMLVIVVSLTFVAVLLMVYSIIVTRRSKKKVELLLKELHHRVKNNLQVLSSVLSLQSQQLTDSNAIQAVKSSEGRVNAMALIHRKLYLGDTNRTIDIKDYVTELVGYLVHTYGYHDRDLKLDLQIEPISVDVDKAIPLGLILNELISNAFKYAYAEHAHPELYVGVSTHAPGALMIQVRDNGKGMPEPKKDAPVSFGLKMVNTLIRELRGSLDVTATKGTTYILNIPL